MGHFANNARAELYNPTQDGIAYCMKLLHEPGNKWEFRNLDLFLDPRSAPTNFRARRRVLRQRGRLAAAR
jgi:hypothetical protein